MKTLGFALLTGCIAMTAAKLHGQGIVYLNNYDSGMGIFMIDIGQLIAVPVGTPVQVLAGATPDSLTPARSYPGLDTVFHIPEEGRDALGPGSGSFFDENYGLVPSVPPGGTAFFNVRAYFGPSWEEANIREETGVWSQQVGTYGAPTLLAMPRRIVVVLVDIPEPSTLALAALAAAGWLIFTRWKSEPSARV